MQRRGIPAVLPAGLVTSDPGGDAVLITEYLTDSVPWRTLLADLPGGADPHRARVCEAVAVFLVDLHRQGVLWGDCSCRTCSLTDGQLPVDLDKLPREPG